MSVKFNKEQFPQDPLMNWGLAEARLHTGNEAGEHVSLENVSTLPQELILPPSLYGDLLKALVRQSTSPFSPEESQFIGTQWSSPLFVDTTPRTGDEKLESPVDEVKRWLKKNSATVTYWHTHNEAKSPYFTNSDLARALTFSDRAILTVLATPKYIWCLVKTKQVPRNTKSAQESFSTDWKFNQEISQIFDSDERPPDFSQLSSYLNDKGYGLYVWFDPEGSNVADAYIKGNFVNNEITLRRIAPDDNQEIIQQLKLHAEQHLLKPEDMPYIPDETFPEFLGKITGLRRLTKAVRNLLKGK